MFGFTTVNKPEMKFKEYDLYHSYYCGLCTVLKKKYGLTGEFTLSYDGAFLSALLSDLYDAKEEVKGRRCGVHPGVKHVIRVSDVTEYAADMNILMAMYKCRDDWNDEKRISAKLLADLLKSKTGKTRAQYAEKSEIIKKALSDMDEIEKKNVPDPEGMAELFGKCMAEVYAYKNDEWEKYLRTFGDELGRAIYLMDAFIDIENDEKKKQYNPFSDIKDRDDFEGLARDMITAHLQEACIAFEKMPLIENVSILRNVLYSGIWIRFNIASGKRNPVHKTEDVQSDDGGRNE